MSRGGLCIMRWIVETECAASGADLTRSSIGGRLAFDTTSKREQLSRKVLLLRPKCPATFHSIYSPVINPSKQATKSYE